MKFPLAHCCGVWWQNFPLTIEVNTLHCYASIRFIGCAIAHKPNGDQTLIWDIITLLICVCATSATFVCIRTSGSSAPNANMSKKCISFRSHVCNYYFNQRSKLSSGNASTRGMTRSGNLRINSKFKAKKKRKSRGRLQLGCPCEIIFGLIPRNILSRTLLASAKR